ncbi:hypothetical protein N657DRAFT_645869 [Parathielavia appendiculata]|uniref:Zn(2)-C6 fungal-type domain-containing protein n=1 Tax=Parathielavia appendiculata TaxID=2587402 RepID=A0AAN6TYU6_9PEZI|nr:hypothetical protein N657DRAFT_645869 [Parathielavia appendiculata]
METSQHTFIPESGLPTQRRRKARLACTPCRARKTGCDGKKPVCTACSLRGWEDKCSYPDTVMQASTALALVELERRLQKLENGARADPSPSRQSAAEATPPADPTSGPAAARVHDQDIFATDHPTTALSSTFLCQGLEAAGSRRSHSPSAESDTSALDSPMFPSLVCFSTQTQDQSGDEVDLRAMVLPPRQFADDLLRWYWQHIHSVFPFLHWPIFESKYRSLWEQQAAPTTSHPFDVVLTYATVNMVLALAYYRTETVSLEQRQCHADEFYNRSLRLVSAETLDTSSIAIVQLLLLRAWYLYFSGKADRCWLVSGAATRMAIGLGLHAPPKRHLNQLDREMRYRVWYGGCVALDQIITNTFGRPGMIVPGLTHIPPPLAIDEEYLSTTEEGRQPEGLPSRMDMNIYSMKILEIMEEMRAAARAPQLKLKQSEHEVLVPDPGVLLRLSSKIDDLLDGVPPHLRLEADYSQWALQEDEVTCFRIQGHALRFRLLLLRLFLLRPSLLAEAQRWTTARTAATQTASMMLQERFHQEACSLCLAAVHTILEEVHRSLTTNTGISAWFALHFTFASATVLLVATLSPNLGVSLDTEPTKSSWDRAMAILNHHKRTIASVTQGMEILRRYRDSLARRAAARSGTCASTNTGTIPTITLLPNFQAQEHHGQQLHESQSWEHSQPVPVPPTAGTGLMEGLDEFLTSDSLDEAWLVNQDFGQGDWMLHF